MVLDCFSILYRIWAEITIFVSETLFRDFLTVPVETSLDIIDTIPISFGGFVAPVPSLLFFHPSMNFSC